MYIEDYPKVKVKDSGECIHESISVFTEHVLHLFDGREDGVSLLYFHLGNMLCHELLTQVTKTSDAS